jgi:aminoglycoside phosphotransferase (APT) family kinase protein
VSQVAEPIAGFREPPEPRAVLRAAGVARADEARLHDVSRSHALTFAELPDGSAYVVKRVSPEAHADGRSLAAELYAYRLASWRPGLAAVLPQPVHLDERRQVLALVAAPPQHLYAAQALRPGFPPPELAAALGRALAALHAATVGVPLVTTAACGVLHMPDAREGDIGMTTRSEAARAVARVLADDAELAPSLRRTARLLRPSCLVHADVKWDNAVLDPGPPARVRLFDWELSGRGDPAWDVGAAVADTVSLTVRLHGSSALPGDPARWLTPALEALLGAYGGSADGLSERVAGCWVARTVHLALECAAALDDPGDGVVHELLGCARRLAGRNGAVVAAVHDALAGRR